MALIAYAEGKSREECAERVERTWKCVHLWIKAYHANGSEGLIDGRKAGNRKLLLSEAEQRELARKVGWGTPENNDMGAPQWTGALIQDLIKRDYGVSYSRGHISKLMNRIGVSHIQTKEFYPEGDPEAAQAFGQEIQETRDNLAPDEAGLSSTASLSRAWTTKGERRLIAQTQRKKERRAMMATIEPATGKLTQTVCKTGNSETFIKHLDIKHLDIKHLDIKHLDIKHLEKILRVYQNKRKITVVLDNARFHKSKKVKAWLEKNLKKTLKSIPAYRPQLNVVERYWREVRKYFAHNPWVKSMNHRLRELRIWSTPFKQPNLTLKLLCEI